MLGRRTAFYAVLSLGVISALRELGFELNALLGAAGVMTVAIGFAAQTSTSNLIAGLFLIGERPFVRVPLAEVAAPGLVHPVTGERLDRVSAGGGRRLDGHGGGGLDRYGGTLEAAEED